MAESVLVTGASGFVGRHCLPHCLDGGLEVHAVSRRRPPPQTEGVVWHRLDLFDFESTTALLSSLRPTHLLHLAWVSEHGTYWTSPENLDWIRASLHLMRVFAACGGRRALTAGSCAEYDWSSGICREDATPLRPSTLYGTCKHALQLVHSSFFDAAGVSAAWGRVFLLYGPGEQEGRLVSSVIRSLLRERSAPCSHGEQIRDFLYVDDAAAALVALLVSEVSGPVNVASGEPLRVKDLVTAIGRRLGRLRLVDLGALPTREGDPPQLLADTTRLREEVGFVPRFGLERGIEESIAFWRDRLENERE